MDIFHTYGLIEVRRFTYHPIKKSDFPLNSASNTNLIHMSVFHELNQTYESTRSVTLLWQLLLTGQDVRELF
jgi:hypothetical protein